MSAAWEAYGPLRETPVSCQVSSVMEVIYTVPPGFTGGQPGAHWPLLTESESPLRSILQQCLVRLVEAAESKAAASTLSDGPRTPTSDKMSVIAPPPDRNLLQGLTVS